MKAMGVLIVVCVAACGGETHTGGDDTVDTASPLDTGDIGVDVAPGTDTLDGTPQVDALNPIDTIPEPDTLDPVDTIPEPDTLEPIDAEVPCVPDCLGKECGDDGCGGSCGECAESLVCAGGLCCLPDCGGNECGDDGCGGSCGECTMLYFGCHDGECSCEPDCTEKTCGPDGCGGSCLLCPDGMLCGDGACPCPEGSDLWVDPSLPSDTPGVGTYAKPFSDLDVALEAVQPEDTIHMLPGSQQYGHLINVPCIEIRGETMDAAISRIAIEASDVTLRGLRIDGYEWVGVEAYGIENLHLDNLEFKEISNYFIAGTDEWGNDEQWITGPAPVAVALTDVENAVIEQVFIQGVYAADDWIPWIETYNWDECDFTGAGFDATGLRCEGCTNLKIDGLEIKNVRGGDGDGDCLDYMGPCCASDGGNAYGIYFIDSTWGADDVSISQIYGGDEGGATTYNGESVYGSAGASFDIFESP